MGTECILLDSLDSHTFGGEHVPYTECKARDHSRMLLNCLSALIRGYGTKMCGVPVFHIPIYAYVRAIARRFFVNTWDVPWWNRVTMRELSTILNYTRM